MFASIILGIIGVIFVIVGYLVWRKEKVSLLHGYHYNKVSEKDKKKFCALSGLGIIIIGTGILLTSVIFGITDSVLSFFAFLIGFSLGIGLLVHAGNKYNL